jgi:tRNA threonylcarbamoyladenosine biosynthesis protein TsaB
MVNGKLPILAIECSSPFLSLAIQTDAAIFTHQQEGQRQHSQFILEKIKELLTQASLSITDIKTIAVGNGPGSFIGVRLAHAVAQGLCLPSDKQLITLSSLQMIAQSLHLKNQAKTILVAQDARKQEVYACAYQLDNNVMQPIIEEQLLTPEALADFYNQLSEQSDLAIIGNGWSAYQDTLNINQQPYSLDNCQLAEGAIQLTMLTENNDTHSEPNYVRNHVADLPKKK